MTSDGNKEIAGYSSLCSMIKKLPEALTQIDVVFRKGEHSLHSMMFHGKTTVHIGYTDDMLEDGVPPDDYAGRVATFKLLPGEELLGCEIHHD